MNRIIFVSLLFFMFSCSLKYTTNNVNVEKSVPEFVFTNADFTRYENNKESIIMNAKVIEQYKGGTNTYANDVQFKMNNEEGVLETEGKCALLASDTYNEVYSLYDGIELTNHKRKVTIKADTLRWNGKTEQLISNRSDTITITKDGSTIIGSGFSASGVSNQFSFTGAVSGVIETSENTDETIKEN